MGAVAIVGTGFVADLYMRSLKTFPGLTVRSAYDRNPERLAQFCSYWGLTSSNSLDDLLETVEQQDVVLNLTNPAEHFDVSRACLQAGKHVYSEKPFCWPRHLAAYSENPRRRYGARYAIKSPGSHWSFMRSLMMTLYLRHPIGSG